MQSPDKGVKHEQKTTAARRSCHRRADRRWRFEQSCRERQQRVEGDVIGAGDAALEGLVRAVEGVIVGAGDAAAEGFIAVKGSSPAPASSTHESRMQQWMASVRREPLATQSLIYTTRKLRPLVALTLVGLIGLVSAGCGANASSKTGTARSTGTAGSASSAGTTSSAATTSSGAHTKLTAQEKAVKFAECMRANGVPHFPDPDTKGAINFGVDVTVEVWRKAVDACKALKPPGALSSKRTPKEQAASLRFAQCVRDHGVKDFPDPVNGEPLIDTYKIPSSNKPGGMTILNAATHACGSILKLSAGGQG
jgi:hypothetical protein